MNDSTDFDVTLDEAFKLIIVDMEHRLDELELETLTGNPHQCSYPELCPWKKRSKDQ